VRVRVFPNPQQAAHSLACKIADEARHNPGLVLGLPTGRTPIPLYRALVALHRSGDLDFAPVTTFNLDEFVGLGYGDAGSYRTFMETELFAQVNADPRRTHFLDGRAADLANECTRFERAIARAGGIDLLVLGLGGNGHIGFNEPGDALAARTHRTPLTRATRLANVALFGSLSRVPREGVSMGIATILQARRIVLLATGAGKARSVARMIQGPVTPRVPASFLQLHTATEVWLDVPAASQLQRSGPLEGRSILKASRHRKASSA